MLLQPGPVIKHLQGLERPSSRGRSLDPPNLVAARAVTGRSADFALEVSLQMRNTSTKHFEQE